MELLDYLSDTLKEKRDIKKAINYKERYRKLQYNHTAFNHFFSELQKVIKYNEEADEEDEDLQTDVAPTESEQQNQEWLNAVQGQNDKYRQLIESKKVVIGPNGTTLDAVSFKGIGWTTYKIATRGLLMAIFGTAILATHSMTGKSLLAFRGRGIPVKKVLDPLKVADIVHCVMHKFNCKERLIRTIITAKCSDEFKKKKRLENQEASMQLIEAPGEQIQCRPETQEMTPKIDQFNISQFI